MKRLLAVTVLTGAALGVLTAWLEQRTPELDEAAINQKVDARLHQVLAQLLEDERRAHALASH